MGICSSAMTEEELAQQRRNQAINNQLKRDYGADSEIIKLLLLGAGESGKSTIFKQMKLLYGEEKSFSEQKRKNMVGVIHGNIISSMQTLINHSHVFGDSASGEAKEGAELGSSPDLAGWAEASQFSEGYSDKLDVAGAELVKTLWAHEKIQNTYAARSKFQLADSSAYYFDKVGEIAAEGYLPSDADILRSRVRTSGIVEEKYNIEGVTFSMYDVGGQRNERKKWIHCFENVTAVIFVASLSAYDQVLYEDENTNRMQEAINLFGQICNEDWFRETSIILFMNKKDLFEEKIRRVNPKDVMAPNGSKPWGDFPGELGDEQAGFDYFGEKFLSMNQDPETHAVTKHNTCATDTDNVRVVFETCKSVILEENLSNAGFM